MRAVLLLAIAACGAAPRGSAAPVSPAGWWEIDDGDAAGVLGGAALRLGAEPAVVVMPAIPAFEICRVTTSGARITLGGIGQPASAVIAGDRMTFDGGFGAHRASPERAAELDRIVPAVQAACDHARSCYRAAVVVLGIENREGKDFGPLLRTDACTNIVANLVDDMQSAGKPVPAECN